MNRHYIVESKPGEWVHAAIQAAIYACIFFGMGYFARPILEKLL